MKIHEDKRKEYKEKLKYIKSFLVAIENIQKNYESLYDAFESIDSTDTDIRALNEKFIQFAETYESTSSWYFSQGSQFI
jgi:hypothetical protein